MASGHARRCQQFSAAGTVTCRRLMFTGASCRHQPRASPHSSWGSPWLHPGGDGKGANIKDASSAGRWPCPMPASLRQRRRRRMATPRQHRLRSIGPIARQSQLTCQCGNCCQEQRQSDGSTGHGQGGTRHVWAGFAKRPCRRDSVRCTGDATVCWVFRGRPSGRSPA